MMRWWWFGPAVTDRGLEREMRTMKEGGIGGFEVQPVYPLAPDDETQGIRNASFLSPTFLEALRFTSVKARELGLRMDLTLGSGWPFGGPQVPVNLAAARLRLERAQVKGESFRVPLPGLSNGESFLAAFAAGSERELTHIKDGFLWLPEGTERPSEVLFFISSRTGQMVKRAAVGAEGFVLDHYDRAALDNYLKNVADPLLQGLGLNAPYAVFCDSLEVYGGDWTGDFLDAFRQRRGYDLRPRLPALVEEIGPQTAAIRHDWGKTLTELVEDRFLIPLSNWAKAHRTQLRIQGYGIPPAALSSNAVADLMEGEGHQWKKLTATRWASSASHLYGRAVTSSETWTWLNSPVFRATPLDMKAEADRHFLQGITQLIGHGWPYTPEGVEYPGWRFYAAGVFNERNPWWIVMPDLSRYLQRLSYLLRQGKPANDVALYLPNADAWSHFSPGRVNLFETLGERLGPNVIAQILDAGYGFDFFDDRSLEQAGRLEKDRLILGGNSYRLVVLPSVEAMPVSTVRRLVEFVRQRGLVVATRRLPDTAPGLLATDAEKKEVRETLRTLFESPAGSARLVANEMELGNVLSSLLRPDIALSPPVPDIGFVHRRAYDAEIYFLANTSNVTQRTQANFRVEGMEPEWWDPMTGSARPAQILGRGQGTVALALAMEPYGSRVLVFTRRPTPPLKPATQPRTLPPVVDISSGWQVTFSNGRRVAMEQLRSWTEDEATQYYSGLATYEKTVVIPQVLLRTGIQINLEFGEGKPTVELATRSRIHRMQAQLDPPVREAAVVTLNGRRAGSVWCPPYSLDVTSLLKNGDNQLRIVVGNLALNYMAGHPLPDYKLLNLRYGVRFEPQDMDMVKAISAGLLGPIRLVPKASE